MTTAYSEVLGSRLATLDPACRALHHDVGTFHGEISVETSRWSLIRTLSRWVGFPPAMRNAPFVLATSRSGPKVTWQRDIGPVSLASQQWRDGDHLVERMGPMTVAAHLEVQDGGCRLQPRWIKALGVPLPPILWPHIDARDWAEGDLYRFDIRIGLPLSAGPMIRYHGWLQPSLSRS